MSRTHVGFRPTPDAATALGELPGEVTTSHDPSGQERAALLADVAGCDAVVTLLTQRVDDELLDAAGPALRIVANVAVGHDNVDLEACRRRGVVVTTTPGVLDGATADLTLALVLATARRVVEADAFIRAGNAWTWSPDLFVGLDVTGATLGIVGFGRIGQQVARRAAAFDMRVLATPSRSGAAAAAELGVETMPLDRLLGESDVVSLHCPLTPETRHLIGADQLALMRPEAILVNTARGPVVDEAALAAALVAGQIGGAGLDVFEHEPAIHPDLVGRPDVVLLPHIGSAGRRTRLRMLELALDNVRAVLAGETPPTPV